MSVEAHDEATESTRKTGSFPLFALVRPASLDGALLCVRLFFPKRERAESDIGEFLKIIQNRKLFPHEPFPQSRGPSTEQQQAGRRGFWNNGIDFRRGEEGPKWSEAFPKVCELRWLVAFWAQSSNARLTHALELTLTRTRG